MIKRKSSAEETRIHIPEESSKNFKHFEVQSGGKSLLVMASETPKCNLKNVFTDTAKSSPGLVEKNIPKIKFSVQNESEDLRSPSPRLKSFPVEKIKKIDGNVFFQPSISFNRPMDLSNLKYNIGHGDAIATSQQIQITPRHQPEKASRSQQNISYFYKVNNTNQSEVFIPSQKLIIPVLQHHRPFVSNLPYVVLNQEHASKKQVTPKKIVSHMPIVDPIDLSVKSNQEQKKSETKHEESLKNEQNPCEVTPQLISEISSSNLEEQPVGGRVSVLLHQKLLEKKPILQEEILQNQIQHNQHQVPQENQLQQKKFQQQLSSILPEPYDRAVVCPNADHYSTIPRIENVRQQPTSVSTDQQVHQQLQNNAAYQQQMHERAMMHQQQMMWNQMQQKTSHHNSSQRNQQVGMTSPQDQKRHQETCVHHMHMSAINQNYLQELNPTYKDNLNGRVQFNQFAIDFVNPHQSQCNVQTNYQQSVPTKQITSYNQSNLENDQMKSTNQQQTEILDTSEQSPHAIKVHHYTSEMLKDQEQLINTMHQQRISDDVMRRQFHLLLSEQKKQLIYLDQMAQRKHKIDQRNKKRVSKKAAKIQKDEKPEWMSHITPSRITYCDLEKMRNYGSAGQNVQNCVMEHQAHQQQSHQCQQEQLQYHQHRAQQEQLQHHQQQILHHQNMILNQQQSENQLDIHQQKHLQHHLEQFPHHQNQVQHQQNQTHQQQHHTYPDYLEQHHQNSCQNCQLQHSMMNFQRSDLHISSPPPYNVYPLHSQNYPSQFNQQYPQFLQYMSQNCQHTSVLPNHNPQHTLKINSCESKGNSKTVEPSSLLQLRIYKEIIKPQKRNNGLQDPETVKEALEGLKTAETKKGLEYLANLNKKETVIKLNGIQEPGEIPNDKNQKPIIESFLQIPEQVSANGLENQRNPDNPPPPAVKMKLLSQVNEYPRLKRQYQPQNYIDVAERENGSIDPNFHHQYLYNQELLRSCSPNSNFENIQHEFYKNPQLFDNNGQGNLVPEMKNISGSEYIKQLENEHRSIQAPTNQHESLMIGTSEIQEPRIIGGVTYLARKK